MRNFTEVATIKDYLIVRAEGARQALRNSKRSKAATIKDYLIVRQQGGLGKVHPLFGDKLNTVLSN